MTTGDIELVREYAAHRSESAFETLVSRYVNLVYATALRQVRDPHLAEEITQAVFIILARKAGSLNADTILPAWLYRTACFASADALKIQRRRQRHEREALMQSEHQRATPDPLWEQISPHLDEALMRLAEKDRQAVVLHFFEKKTFAEAGLLLGTTEEGVRKRTHRAVEKLRQHLSRRGMAATSVPSAVIDSLPPMVKMLPTKYPPPWVDWNAGSNGDKFAGSRARASDIAFYAYGYPRVRIRFAPPEPTNRYDFIATLPHGSAEALQRELRAKLGLVGRPVTENRDVLLLKVVHPNAPGLKPPIPEKTDNYWNRGIYRASNATIGADGANFEGLTHFLEEYFDSPIIDQTGLIQHYSLELKWRAERGHPNLEGLKQVLLDQLGLELVPTNRPVEILVMEKVP